MMKLQEDRIEALPVGQHAAGVYGLYMTVRDGSSGLRRLWTVRLRQNGKRTMRGVGTWPSVSLTDAVGKAQELNPNGNRRGRPRKPQGTKNADVKVSVRAGKPTVRVEPKADPALVPVVVQPEPADVYGAPTLQELVVEYGKLFGSRFKSERDAYNWLRRFELHLLPALGNVPVDQLRRRDVQKALLPAWTGIPSAGRKVRQQLKQVLGYAVAVEYCEFNAAGPELDSALPPQPKRQHHRALPYEEVPDFYANIGNVTRATPSMQLCFRFLVLTAVRSNEARGATWDEIDCEAGTWTIPAGRMKAGIEHRVPLSVEARYVAEAAMTLLPPHPVNSKLVFPSNVSTGNGMLTPASFRGFLNYSGYGERTTTHGFRTSFKTWTMEQTDTPWAVGEAALSHMLGNPTEQAYARSDLFDKRHDLMQQWADYVTGQHDESGRERNRREWEALGL